MGQLLCKRNIQHLHGNETLIYLPIAMFVEFGIAVCIHFNMIHLDQLEEANMKIVWKRVQAAILTTISNLLYVLGIARLYKDNLFIYFCSTFLLC